MKKKQIDLLGKEIPDYIMKQIEDKIKDKQKTPLFSENELKSFSNLIKQEQDILNLSKDSIVKELWRMKLFEEAEKKQERTKIIDKFVKLVNQLQELKKDKDYLRVITKLFDSNKILYQFIIEESTNLYNQFRRFLSFLSLLVFLSQDIVNSTQHAVEHASSLVAGPFKSNDINQYYKEEEDRIISDITLHIYDNNLIYNIYGDNKKYYFPLDFDTIKNSGKYFKLKNNYVLKSDHPYVLKRNFIKKLPYFFKNILLEHEERVDFDENGSVISLDLSSLSLPHLPNELEHFPKLVRLYLGRNQLWDIPNSIGKLKSLVILNLSFNPIITLPESIGNLRMLKYLTMSHCSELKTLPESLSNLKNLERIDLTCSNLEVVPEALRILLGRGVSIDLDRNKILIKPLKIKELKRLAKKIKVEKNFQAPYVIHEGIIYFAKPDSNEKYSLDLSSKEITDLDEIKGLKKLKNLKSLVLSHNKISELKYLDLFRKLKVLIVGHNQIQKIRGLGNLTKLEMLDLSFNFIHEISGLETLINLRSLYLNNNNIKEIKGLENLVNLRTLNLTGNNIREVKGLENLKSLTKMYLSHPRHNKPSELNKLLRKFNTDAKKYVEYCQKKSHLEVNL